MTKLKQIYYVWDPSIEDRDAAGEYTAFSPSDAGEFYVQDNFDGGEDYIVMVEDSNGQQYEVAVDVEWEPFFDSYVRAKK